MHWKLFLVGVLYMDLHIIILSRSLLSGIRIPNPRFLDEETVSC
jgi:hypothetical protein